MFGQAPATSPFGSPAPAPFGGFGQPNPAPATGGFGQPTSSFGGTTSTFGQPTSTFGQTPAPAPFGQPAAPAFGAPATGSLFGSAAPAPTGFGAQPAPAPAFGSPAPFGAPKPAGGSLFGAAPAPSAGGLFGSSTPAPSIFGAPVASPAAPFGSTPSSTPFGAPAPSAFNAPAPSTFGAFGSPAPAAPATVGFGAQQQQQAVGTAAVPYQKTNKQDGTNQIVLQAITAMPQYEQKSFEELRVEDYLAGNKGTKGQAAPAGTGFGFGAPQPAPAFGQPAPAPAGGLFGSAPAAAPTGGLFGAPPAAPAFGQPAPAPAFGAPAPTAGGLFGSPAPAPTGFGAQPAFGQPAPAPAPLFGQPAPAPSGLFGAPAPAPSTGGLFGQPAAAPAPLFGQPAPAPSGLFGAPAPAPSTGGLFGSTAAPSTSLFGQPAAAPQPGGLFGAPAPAPSTGGLFGSTAAPSTSLFGQPAAAPAPSLFGQPAPAPTGLFGAPAPAPTGGLFHSTPAAPAVPIPPPPSAEAILAQQLAAVENQKKQLELLDAWRGNPPSGSKVVPTSQYDADYGSDWNGGGESYAASSSALLCYRAAPRSTAKIRPRGYTPTKNSPVTLSLGKKTGSPILSPNRFVGSATKTLFIKPNSLTPKPKTRLLLTDGVSTGDSSAAAAVVNGTHQSPNADVPTQELTSPTLTNGSQPKPIDSTSPQMARGSPSSPAHDFYRQVVDGRSPSASSPLQAEKQFVPKLTKAGYDVYPSIADLEAMSEADLAAVTGFKVERQGYGSVRWDGAVDVRGVDLDAVVVIEYKNVSVYDEAEEKGEKPQQGSKLNRPAVITMHGIYPKDGAESSAEAKEKLKRKIEKSTKKMGAELLSFEEDSGVWMFRVGHFSRYGLDDDDSDDDSDMDINATPSLATVDDEQESVNPVEQMKELGGTSRLHAPIDEDESTAAYSASETVDHSEIEEEDTRVYEIVQAGEEAYAMMTEEVLDDYEEQEAIIPYEPFVDEVEEEKLLFPIEGEDYTSPSVNQPLTPALPISIPAPSTGICNRLAKKCGLKTTTSSDIDFGIRMRRSFRVGWKPDGSFIKLKPSCSGTQVLVQSRPNIEPTSAEKTDNVGSSLPLLQTHHKHSIKAKEGEHDAPIFTLPRNSSAEIKSLFDALEDYSKASASATRQVVSNSFSLLMCLNGGDKTARDEYRRLEAVSSWLKGVVSADTMRAISSAQSSGDIYGSIFAAFAGGDIASASSLALESGNSRLSLMLSNTGIQAQPFCKNQLKMWGESGAQPFTPTGILRLFSLASGDVDIERKMFKSSSSYDIDWRRRLGMLLWPCSHSHNEVTVSSIVKQYDCDVSAGVAPSPKPLYCADAAKATNQCVLYQLLKHHSDASTPLMGIVSPSSHTPYFHDFSASFHLVATVTALSTSTLSHHHEDLIVDAVTYQLISEGYWEWAAYASLCFIGSGTMSDSEAFARRQRAKNIISRFYSPSTDPSAASRRSFLQNIGIPPQWFDEALAYRCASVGDAFGMVSNLRFSAVESMAAMEELMIPHMILEGKESMKRLWQLLESLRTKITDDCIDVWNRPGGCGMYHKFIELYSEVEKLSSMPLDNVVSGTVDDLLDVATHLQKMISTAKESTHGRTSLPFVKIDYGFTRTPRDVVLAEVGAKLSIIRLQLLAAKHGQPAEDCDSQSSKRSSHFTQGVGLFDDSFTGVESGILRGFCGFKAMG